MRDRKTLFDAWAADYNAIVDDPVGFPFAGYAAVVHAVADEAAAQRGSRVLDVGAGTGNLSRLFVDLGCVVTGIDFSDEMIAIASASVPDATFLQLDLLRSWDALEDQRFNRIVSSYVLHEFDPATKLSILSTCMNEHLCAGGSMVIGDIAFPTAREHDTASKQWQQHWDTSEHYWIADETLAACQAAGIHGTYRQVSPFAGVFRFQPSGQ